MRRYLTPGFTLIELMIALLIISLLLSIAYPGYSAHIARSQRTDARANLLRLAADQESYFIRNGSYASNLVDLGFDSATPKTDNGRYQLAITRADTISFEVRADYLNDDAERARCAWFTLDQRHRRNAGPSGAKACWYR